MNILNIKKEDFTDLVPTKLCIARIFVEQLAIISQSQHRKTHEQIYEELEEFHIREFGEKMPWKSFDSFRHFLREHRKEIY